MKKTYVKIDWEITFITNKDVIAASGEKKYDPEGMLTNLDKPDMYDQWIW